MSDKIILSTPVGTAVYPRLKTPDTKFHDLGMYKADLAVPLADAKPLMDRLSSLYEDHTGTALKGKKAKDNVMWVYQLDDAGEETGNVVFKLRVKNKIAKKSGELWDRRPAQFDAALKPIDVNPWGGSEMIVSFEAYCWDTGADKGVSLQPQGVQILKLVEGSGQDAAAMGFATQEGYTAPDQEGSEGLSDQTGGDTDEGDSAQSGDY